MTDQDQKKIFVKNLRYYISQSQKSQKEIADAIGVSPQTFNTWCQGVALPRMGKVQLLANYFNINKSDLIEAHNRSSRTPEDYGLTRLSDVHKKPIPMLGTVACGTPIFANEEHDSYVLADEDIDADYCLTAKGDSMINARIYDGDLIFVKQCSHVENGEIAVVAIGDEVTLKRVYFYPETSTLQLIAENPKYAPLIYRDDELDGVYVIGKALFFQSLIRM
ncbi:MAG: helix-turn-helix domain-containing protein [Lachnospiraceae bacterium]|nr:helix-turn-helix domain-containing protein [Lachnospiraceae bacterium]